MYVCMYLGSIPALVSFRHRTVGRREGNGGGGGLVAVFVLEGFLTRGSRTTLEGGRV